MIKCCKCQLVSLEKEAFFSFLIHCYYYTHYPILTYVVIIIRYNWFLIMSSSLLSQSL